MESEHCYIAIDMKSFYASVECVARGYDPLTTNLLVADESRSDQTICLAVSPSLKAIGVPSRPRLFEAKQAIQKYEREHRTKVKHTIGGNDRCCGEKALIGFHIPSPSVSVYTLAHCFRYHPHLYFGTSILWLSIYQL